MEENTNKLHFQYTDFNSYMRVTVYSECIYVFLFYQNLVLVTMFIVRMGGTHGTHGIPRYQISRYQYRVGHGIPSRSRYFTVPF